MPARKPAGAPKAPKHLRAATRKWFESVVAEFALEQHHVRLLLLAGESWDRGEQAREALATHGITFLDRFGSPRARPEVAVERDCRTGFARLIRELDLDVEAPSAGTRPPALKANRRGA
jgi:phage terminase small subunit